MLITKENISIMLNDTKHPFGHGYCLAMALLDKDIEWVGGNDEQPIVQPAVQPKMRNMVTVKIEE